MVEQAAGTNSNSAIDDSHHFRVTILIESLPFNQDTALAWLADQDRKHAHTGNFGVLPAFSVSYNNQGCGTNTSTTFEGSLSHFCLSAVAT